MKNIQILIFFCSCFIGYSQIADMNKISDIGSDVMVNYRKLIEEKGEDIKKDTLYIRTFNKLKGLYEKQQKSKSFRDLDTLLVHFGRKMDIDYNKNNLEDFKKSKLSMIEWVEKNLDKTTFKTIEEANQEYEVVLNTQDFEKEQNKEFYDYLSTAVKLFGGQIIGDVVFDYEMNHPNSIVNQFLRKHGY